LPRNPLKKLVYLRKTLTKLQLALGIAASALERRRNLLNWTDPAITTVAIGILSMACALLSALLALVPLRTLAFVGGLVLLAPFVVRGAVAPQGESTVADGSNTASTASAANAADDASDDDAENTTDEASSSGASTMTRRPPPAQMVANILARTPDGTDVAHLKFCASEQILEATTLVHEFDMLRPRAPMTSSDDEVAE